MNGDEFGHSHGSIRWVLVLPYAQHNPAELCEPAVSVGITSTIARELVPPVFGVRPGRPTVIWTGVPQAAVHEHGQVMPRKEDVGATAYVAKGQWRIDPIAQTQSVQMSTER